MKLKVRPFGGIPLAILTCPGCGRGGLRVPDGRRGKVTCPRCGAEWFHPETIELSDVEFRCSMSGARFNIISSRRSPLHKFVVQEIKKAPAATRPPAAEPPSSSQDPALKAGAPSLRLAAPSVGGWLARFVGRKADVVPSMPNQASGSTTPVPMHNADEYNWSGFSCPYCGVSSFVSCAGGHLACDGTAELRSGHRFHQCFCGHAGVITGTIKTLKSKRLSVKAKAASPPVAEHQGLNSGASNVALPPPVKR